MAKKKEKEVNEKSLAENSKEEDSKKVQENEKNLEKEKEEKKKKSSFKEKSMKKIAKLKEVKVNKLHLVLGLIVLALVLISYFYVGEIDTSNKDLDENSIINILGYELDLKTTSLLVASIIIGLLDGFNPCAMWVLIYLITLASTLKDKKKMVIIVGTFVATEAIMYFFVLAGWLNFFELIFNSGQSGLFDWLLRVVGAFAAFTGALAVNDYIKKGGQVTCEVGDMESKKKTVRKIDTIMNSPITIASLFATILLAVVVNSFEFICSAGLPAVFTQMLAISDITVAQKYFYITMYDLFFMIDDFIIFGLAFWAMSSDWMGKYSGFSKLFGGIIMMIIGIVLLFFPGLLI